MPRKYMQLLIVTTRARARPYFVSAVVVPSSTPWRSGNSAGSTPSASIRKCTWRHASAHVAGARVTHVLNRLPKRNQPKARVAGLELIVVERVDEAVQVLRTL